MEIGIFITTLLIQGSLFLSNVSFFASALLLHVDWNWGSFSMNLLMIINFEKKIKKLVIVLGPILSFH